MSLTKQDLKEALGTLKKDVDKSLNRLEEKIFAKMVKHFYVKDEIDRKFLHVDHRFDSIEMQFEGFRHDFKAVGETLDLHAKKFSKLERMDP